MEIEELGEHIVLEGLEKGASDVHILPEQNQYFLFLRINGGMVQWGTMTESAGSRLISYFKYLSNMNVGERRKPQSGSVQLKVEKKIQSLRFSTITNFRMQESMVIRILNQDTGLSLNKTAFFKRELLEMEELAGKNSGLLIFSGPVDSGKTTTVYQLVRNNYSRKKQQVITIEDPVEIEESSFLQTEVNEKAGLSYEYLLKSSLRHHPDILIVGEIRDKETAKIVIRAALTGHLIFATIHSKDASGVIPRLLELGVSLEQLSQTLLGIVFQKLVPRSCPLCGGNCRTNCTHHPVFEKRAAIYEMLANERLEQQLLAVSKQPHLRQHGPRSFNKLLRKAYAYGFITKKSVQTFQIS